MGSRHPVPAPRALGPAVAAAVKLDPRLEDAKQDLKRLKG
jgi:hypothetical protein